MANIDGQADCGICQEIMQEREWEVDTDYCGTERSALKLSSYNVFHQRTFDIPRRHGVLPTALNFRALCNSRNIFCWDKLAKNKYLCAFCHHLNLGDFYAQQLASTGIWSISFYLDDFTTLEQKDQCMFCQLIAKIIGRYNSFPGRKRLTRVRLCLDSRLGKVVIRDNNNNHICSFKAPDTHESQPKNALPVLRSQPIAWSKINNWLGRLEDPEVLKEQPPGFRVIDVKKACVVPAPPLCEYVALSYVWGDATGQFQATSSNIGLLECHGSLSKPEVPRTVKDAMHVCSRLNKRYLWVDRFCIIQDDSTSRDLQINAMGSIYSHSYVTLVAMEGHDADFGLCGVSRDRMYELLFQGMRMTEIYKSYHFDPPSRKWMSRGWTLQESVLSTRILIFTEKSLYFKDSTKPQFQHDLDSDLQLEEYIDVTPFNSRDSLYWYSSNVNDYTKRSLGNPLDILRAFTGIMGSLFGKRHLFGLPFAHFGEALLWYPTGHANLRKPEGENKFPTWSWASNTSPVEYQSCLLTIASCAATVSTAASGRWEWSVISIAGLTTNNFSNLESGYHTMDPGSAQIKTLVDGELMFDWVKNPFDRNTGSTEAKLLRKFSLHNHRDRISIHKLLKKLFLDKQCDSPPSWDRIAIHTQKVRLMLDPRTYQVSPGRNMVILRGSKFPVGFLFLDNIEHEESIFLGLRNGEEVFRDNLALSINVLSKDRHVQFNGSSTTAGVFADGGQSRSIRRETIQGNGGAFNFLPPELVSVCSQHNDIFTLNVMAVEKSNSGIFRRIGLGQIFLEKWAGLNPEVGTFMIQ